MNDRVKALLKELGDAINEAVTGCPRVESIMQAIRDDGYEAYLMLEANIAVEAKSMPGEEISGRSRLPEEWFSDDDRSFLKRLRIES
ncbi:MAG TPA: hypothetical protein VF762_13705 [Blastocatellia bacterium]